MNRSPAPSITSRAYGAGAETEFLQPVPALNQTSEWVSGIHRAAHPAPGARCTQRDLDRYGRLYVMLGVQDVKIVSGRPQPEEGGRGLIANHNSGFYADDATLITGVRLHAHMALDHLNGNLSVTH